MLSRYVVMHFRSAARVMELFFWPLMELLVWGFFSVYLQQRMPDSTGRLLPALLLGLVFWDILYRSQQSVSLAFMEELWTRNIVNLLISPLRTWEWVTSAYLYGLIKTGIVGVFLMGFAALFYALDPSILGFYLVPFFLNLMLMGWALGLFTTGLIIHWGHSAEALVWGVPFLVQPFSAIFYPLSVYPDWLKRIALLLPSTWVMEGMRELLLNSVFSWRHFGAALAINLVYLALAAAFSGWMLEQGRRSGQLVRMSV